MFSFCSFLLGVAEQDGPDRAEASVRAGLQGDEASGRDRARAAADCAHRSVVGARHELNSDATVPLRCALRGGDDRAVVHGEDRGRHGPVQRAADHLRAVESDQQGRVHRRTGVRMERRELTSLRRPAPPSSLGSARQLPAFVAGARGLRQRQSLRPGDHRRKDLVPWTGQQFIHFPRSRARRHSLRCQTRRQRTFPYRFRST